MTTFDALLRHHAGEDSRERSTRDPGIVRGLFTLDAARPV
jgi:hypothetical protein